jgi:hypothetical protein
MLANIFGHVDSRRRFSLCFYLLGHTLDICTLVLPLNSRFSDSFVSFTGVLCYLRFDFCLWYHLVSYNGGLRLFFYIRRFIRLLD